MTIVNNISTDKQPTKTPDPFAFLIRIQPTACMCPGSNDIATCISC